MSDYSVRKARFRGTNFDPFNSARKVKGKSNLPIIGRSLEEFEKLETVYREAMVPDVPTFDIDAGHSINFHEWTYTDGLMSFIAKTMSAEINTRIVMLANQWDGEIKVDYAHAIASQYEDKWRSKTAPRGALPSYYHVFFPPGYNRRWMVSRDNVTRAFDHDPAWLFKPHPVMNDEHIRKVVDKFGILRVLDKHLSAGMLLQGAVKVGYTTASELGIVAKLMRREVVDFTLYEHETRGVYYPLYRVLPNVQDAVGSAFNRIWNCPWSGYVHLGTSPEEALDRFKQYKAKTEELRDNYTPAIPRPPGVQPR